MPRTCCRSTTNSSPPSRATTSPARRHSVSRVAPSPSGAVARVVAERVVDVLEAIQVDEQHRNRQLVPLRRSDRHAEKLAEHHAIRQAGQRVVCAQVQDPVFGKFAFADVATDAAVADEPALVVVGRRAADVDVTPRAVDAAMHHHHIAKRQLGTEHGPVSLPTRAVLDFQARLPVRLADGVFPGSDHRHRGDDLRCG